MKKVILIALVILCLAEDAHAMELRHPRDKWFHGSGNALCSAFVVGLTGGLSGQKSKRPALYAFSFCFGLGLIKEFLVDAKADNGDIWANLAGSTVGLVVFEW